MKNTALIASILMILFSCDRNRLFEEFIEIPDGVWNSSNKLHFNVNISDTTSAYNIIIHIRNVNRYEYSNLYLFVTVHSPDGNSIRDTSEILLADEHGNWLGKGAASIFTTAYPYKSNIRFPFRGIYTFNIEQAMRVNDLKYISNVGLRIEKTTARTR